ncbi:HEAT repeat domain-containing protein [Dissulfurirhabdus thermomarina]|uniref:HEAT repeat domain-containing protein n=1 Tax=Dissulfurirhabdus thermomarina TaxID=1765737 RepID=A0A6N9TMF3_DISTH|nr:HEAT repeat domain-containing protein [Dissulfurirhabdus thermomarina]NDY41620.1 HEAT repeat domain-containing protein [Dissulfurirhabdus thermomarina]NMX23337.1 HEAT repeat domain-containing protein [Dissulfurirhabdus thermomarina]
MGSSFGSDHLVLMAEAAGLLAFVLSGALLVQILVLHWRRGIRARRRRIVEDRWRPVLLKALYGIPDRPPPLAAGEARPVLRLWTRMHASVRGAARDRLVRLAREVGAPDRARALFRSRRLRDRLLATTALGRMRSLDDWDEVARLLGHRHAILALTAARALIHMDAERAVEILVPLLVERDDWYPFRGLALLRAAGPGVVSRPLAGALESASWRGRLRLLRYLEAADPSVAAGAARPIARTTRNPAVLAACLRLLKTPEDLDLVRRHLEHPAWEVRVRAAVALGRLGTEADVPRLEALLSDREWWVRYRAAQALAAMPFVDRARLEAIRRRHPDPFARDILGQVAAEGAA